MLYCTCMSSWKKHYMVFNLISSLHFSYCSTTPAVIHKRRHFSVTDISWSLWSLITVAPRWTKDISLQPDRAYKTIGHSCSGHQPINIIRRHPQFDVTAFAATQYPHNVMMPIAALWIGWRNDSDLGRSSVYCFVFKIMICFRISRDSGFHIKKVQNRIFSSSQLHKS